jgi:hypothetical protein
MQLRFFLNAARALAVTPVVQHHQVQVLLAIEVAVDKPVLHVARVAVQKEDQTARLWPTQVQCMQFRAGHVDPNFLHIIW